MNDVVAAGSLASPDELEDGPWVEGRRGLTIIAIFFGLFGGWAAIAPLDAGVVAPGVVKVSGDRQVIQHRDGGQVTKIAVEEGDSVKQGQVLLDLASIELVSQERALAGEVLALEALRARLLAESTNVRPIPRPEHWAALSPEDQAIADAALARQENERGTRGLSLSAQAGVLRQREQQYQARIVSYREQLESLDRQSKLIDDELTGVKSLAEKGFAPLTRVRAVERAAAQIDANRADLNGQIAQSREAIGEMRQQGLALRESRGEDSATQLRDTDMRLAEAAPRLQSARAALDRTRLRAPVSGVVVGLQVHNVGAVIRPGDRIMDIVPAEKHLVVEAPIQPQDADDVRPGQRAEVMLSALEGREAMRLNGSVLRISADSLQDQRTGRDYFTAEVDVSQRELARGRGPSSAKIQPGMPVEIVIPLRKRTALQYLLEPLNQSIWRSFRQH